jgi:branched-chain amino acid transport system ATP-binding protein
MHYKQPGWKAFLRTPSARVEEKAMEERVDGILEFMGLTHLKDELAINLPHGYQRLLGVALALSINPSLLLLDEPATGMNPVEKETMVGLIKKMRDNGSTIVIIEHDMKAMMSLCDRFAVLNFGQKIAEGDPRQVIDQKEVAEAYLGRGV